jgi:hypothetical protein
LPRGRFFWARYWFRQKTFGYGATPNTWQGWLLTLVGVALILAVVLEAMQIPDRRTALTVALSGAAIIFVAMSAITYIKTEGGWRWRSGRDND